MNNLVKYAMVIVVINKTETLLVLTVLKINL